MSLEMKYFVLKPRGKTIHAEASRLAMKAYAMVIQDIDPQFALDLRAWAQKEQEDAA